VNPEAAAAFSLLSAQAVRERAHRMLAIGLNGDLPHFCIDLTRMNGAADLVLDTMRKAYPTLDVPFHSRWRHFVTSGRDCWTAVAAKAGWSDPANRARAEFDLVMVSVFLDAGAGPEWRYRDLTTGTSVGRSEGIALASLAMFAAGTFSSSPDDPLRVDADALKRLSSEQLQTGMQVSDFNPLIGIEGRAGLLRRLGEVVAAKPRVFARNDSPRPGGLFDHFADMATDEKIATPVMLAELLHQLGPIWPSRLSLGGIPLGDCWRHPAVATADATNELMPLHKLSQWLAYSFIEPLQTAGISATDIDGLTGLAEYRNGGLFLDSGILTFRDPADSERVHDVGSTLVVEWRALTVALLDILAGTLRRRLAVDATSLPLTKILEGGTWAAGRRIARERRVDGSPPVKTISDGTVF
jgi:Protein of unknown function (DUF1688)